MDWTLFWLDIKTTIDDTVNTVSSWSDSHVIKWLGEHLLNILIILIITGLIRHFGTKLVVKIIGRTVRPDLFPTESDRKKRVKTLNNVVQVMFQAGTWTLAAMLLISEIKPNYTGALFTSAGVIGVALGFGAQSLIRDFMSGIFIIAENQYRVGDTITLEGVSGVVQSIGIRTTVLRDINGYVHHIPNGIITITTNQTMGHSHINEDITVVPDTDMKKLEEVINKAGQELSELPEIGKKVLEAPHFDRVTAIASAGITIKISGKTTTGSQLKIKSEFYTILMRAFAKNKIILATVPVMPTSANAPSGKLK